MAMASATPAFADAAPPPDAALSAEAWRPLPAKLPASPAASPYRRPHPATGMGDRGVTEHGSQATRHSPQPLPQGDGGSPTATAAPTRARSPRLPRPALVVHGADTAQPFGGAFGTRGGDDRASAAAQRLAERRRQSAARLGLGLGLGPAAALPDNASLLQGTRSNSPLRHGGSGSGGDDGGGGGGGGDHPGTRSPGKRWRSTRTLPQTQHAPPHQATATAPRGWQSQSQSQSQQQQQQAAAARRSGSPTALRGGGARLTRHVRAWRGL